MSRARRWAGEAKPLEERSKGRLACWLQGQRFKCREPREVEIAAKRTALLAEVVEGSHDRVAVAAVPQGRESVDARTA